MEGKIEQHRDKESFVSGLMVSYIHYSIEREQDFTYKIKRANRLHK